MLIRNTISKTILSVVLLGFFITMFPCMVYATETNDVREVEASEPFVYGTTTALQQAFIDDRYVQIDEHNPLDYTDNYGYSKKGLRSSVNEEKPIYEGKYLNVEWSIDKYGCLLINGTGEFKPENPSEERFYYAPWHEFADEITTAVVNLKETTDFSQMFYQCVNLRSVSFVNTETLHLNNMQGVFADCYSLENIHWGSIDTKNVKNMNAVFTNCISLKVIDLSQFNAANVETMSYMFFGCESISDIHWKNAVKSSKLKHISCMFTYCYNMKSCNIKNLDFSGVTSNNAGYVFYQCYGLQEIISPCTTGGAKIELFLDDQTRGLFYWENSDRGVQTPTILSNQTDSETYVKKCAADHWNTFINSRDWFVNNTNNGYYYISENDLERLVSQLTPMDYLNVVGSWGENYLYPNQDPDEVFLKKTKWSGSCYGMSSWTILQNNNWVRLPSGLKGVLFNDTIASEINYYHFQQNLQVNTNIVDEFTGLKDKERTDAVKKALEEGNLALISYAFIDDNGAVLAHAVCGLGLRYVHPHETTNKGYDISDYKYCAVLYDPNDVEVSENSDNNIYFDDYGSFCIPSQNIKKRVGDNRYYLKRVVCDRDYINAIDYYTGSPSGIVRSNTSSTKYRLEMGKKYNITWDGGEASINEQGIIDGDNSEIRVIPDDDADVNKSYITIFLPNSENYSINSEVGFEMYFGGEFFTTYINIEDKGTIYFNKVGDVAIESTEHTNKTVIMGMNGGVIENPWNYMYVSSLEGSKISVGVRDNRFYVEADNLTEAVVKLANEYNEEVDPIILPHNTTRAAFSKGDDGIIIEHNGDVIDDGNDYHQIADGFRASFEITDSWEGGYNALIRIENTSEENIDNWTLTFDYDGEISYVWNAEILSHDGSKYTIKNVGWNQDIAPGQTIEIGLSGQENFVAEPTDYALISGLNEGNTNDFSINVQIYDDWGSGCNGNMTITNNSDTTIEDWVLEFDFDAELTSIWNAEIVSHEGAHYIIKNVQHNSNIEPGQSVSVGFNGGEGAGSTELRGYKLYSYGL